MSCAEGGKMKLSEVLPDIIYRNRLLLLIDIYNPKSIIIYNKFNANEVYLNWRRKDGQKEKAQIQQTLEGKTEVGRVEGRTEDQGGASQMFIW